jgi:nitroimidazol reductase NimA-like FMN-containing flavoprotein (pyridoxamine 5'-phosphate oxidase superfamily)
MGEHTKMSESAGYVEETIRALFKTQKLAVLSTHNSGQPYASLVAFVASGNLEHLYFATARTTRKFHNLEVEPRAAMLMDNRSNQESDIHAAVAVTAIGTAAEVIGQEREAGARLYLSKHPYLQDFIQAESCALIRLAVETYYFVNRFQQVMELHILP